MSYPSKEEYEKLSLNQQKFVRSCRRRGLKLHSYSGRFMYGRSCAAITVSRLVADALLRSFKSIVCWDEMGRDDLVIYARD